jgi:hypothetical protein
MNDERVSPHDHEPLRRTAESTGPSVHARPVVLALAALGAAWTKALRAEFDVEVSAAGPAAWDVIGRKAIAVAVLGPDLPGAAASTFLADTRRRYPALATRFIVLAAGSDLSLFQDFVDDDTVFFLTESPVGPNELLAIVRSAAANWPQPLRGAPPTTSESAEEISRLRRILDIAHTFAVQNDALATAELAARAVCDLVSAERAYCPVYDARDQVLRSRGADGETRTESAAAGIVSFTARTGLVLCVPCAGQDSRYDRNADDPEGAGDERLLAVPVSDGHDSQVLAVLVAVRVATRAEFEAEDVRTLSLLARHVGSALGRLALHAELERAAAHAGMFLGRPATDVYRAEALRHHVSAGEFGAVLRVSDRWMTWTYRLIALALLASFLYVSMASVGEYADGLAVVRLDTPVDTGAAPARDGHGDLTGRLVAFLPGHYLPTLRPGLPLWLVLNGFPHEPQRFIVESVDDEVMDRERAQRHLGRRVSADILPPGPVVLVRARLQATSFVTQGQHYRYHDGMIGSAQVRVNSERLLTVLVPTLKPFFHD